jgi:hypothetical protein
MITDTQPQLATMPGSPEELRPCAVCSHDLANHDRVGLRYCQASQANALPRNCICRSSSS